METEIFVQKLKDVIVDENLDTFRKIYETTVITDKIKQDPYWNDVLTFYKSLSEENRNILFSIIRQTIIDTGSTILGTIDGSVTLENVRGEFLLTYDDNTEGEQIDKLLYLQDHFLNLFY